MLTTTTTATTTTTTRTPNSTINTATTTSTTTTTWYMDRPRRLASCLTSVKAVWSRPRCGTLMIRANASSSREFTNSRRYPSITCSTYLYENTQQGLTNPICLKCPTPYIPNNDFFYFVYLVKPSWFFKKRFCYGWMATGSAGLQVFVYALASSVIILNPHKIVLVRSILTGLANALCLLLPPVPNKQVLLCNFYNLYSTISSK